MSNHKRKLFRATILTICLLLTKKILSSPPNAVAATTYTNGVTITAPGVYENLDVSNPSGPCVKITASNVTLKNSKIHDCYGFGIWVESAHDVQVLNNEVYNTVLDTCYPNCSGGWASALKVRSENQTDKLAYNILFENNNVHNNLGEGIAARGSKVTIRNNTFYDNFSVNIYTNGDNTIIERNLVYCTGDTRYNRDNNLPSGIAQGDESYANWNPSHANNLLVQNNIVTGCKYGFSYLGAESGVNEPGLKNSTIAFNTFACTSNAAIRVPYESNQNNLTIHNNIGGSNLLKIDNQTGISQSGNISKSFTCKVYSPDNFKLSGPLEAKGTYTTTTDFANNTRTAPIDAGAFDYLGSSQITPTSTPTPVSKTGDANNDKLVNEADFTIWKSHYLQALTGPTNGDFSLDGKVNGVDYVLWLNNYGL